MTQLLDYGAAERRTTLPVTLCLRFSAAALPATAVSTFLTALLWHVAYGDAFQRLLLVVAIYCAAAALLGLVTFWIVALAQTWLRPPGSRSVVAGTIAGAGYGFIPAPLLALAEGLDWLGGEVFVIALAIIIVVVPTVLALWLTSPRVRRTWGFVPAAAICASVHFVTAITCLFVSRVFDENVNYPWRQIGAAIERFALFLVLPVHAVLNGRATRAAAIGALAANSIACGVVLALIYRAMARRSDRQVERIVRARMPAAGAPRAGAGGEQATRRLRR